MSTCVLITCILYTMETFFSFPPDFLWGAATASY